MPFALALILAIIYFIFFLLPAIFRTIAIIEERKKSAVDDFPARRDRGVMSTKKGIGYYFYSAVSFPFAIVLKFSMYVENKYIKAMKIKSDNLLVTLFRYFIRFVVFGWVFFLVPALILESWGQG